jgi:hypothetical protein
MSGIIDLTALHRRLAAAVIVLFIALASLLVYAKATRTARGAYAPADDCPRGALVYAQVSDLPALLRLWGESKLKEKYLASTNFRQFQNGHVALKLAGRLQEFNDSLGFTLDVATLADATEKKAAVAVYNIGRMEMVFVAPVGEEKALAARFFEDADRFEKTELPDGTIYYSRDVEADRGRQKQQILFAFARGRFILATGEQLMLRTLANVNGKSRSDSLSDDPSFKTLSGEVNPHFVAVWVDQARLNNDYYFKHYWAMGDAARLEGIRAGIFDFERREGSWMERREYLLQAEARRRSASPSRQDLQDLAASIPGDAAYARLRVLEDGAETAASLIGDTLLDRLPVDERKGHGRGLSHDDFNPSYEADDDYSWGGYSYLGEDYEQAINDPSDAEDDAGANSVFDTEGKTESELERVLGAARPVTGALAESPLAQDGPLFVEFRRSAVLALDNPDGLDRQALERAIEALVVGRLTVAGTAAGLKWAEGGEGSRRWRELELPMLGWKLCYALRGRELFVSNDAAFLSAALAGGGDALRHQTDTTHAPDDLTLIRFDRREQAFDRVFERLDARQVIAHAEGRGRSAGQSGERTSEEFFSGNVTSLLDVASAVSRVEIRRRSSPGRLYVEVEVVLDSHS